MMKKGSIFTVLLLLSVGVCHAVAIGDFPGLRKLIERADAIVILRVDDHINYQPGPTLYTTHSCFIYQTLKGDIPKETRIPLQLMDTRSEFVTPFALLSSHLMFLAKKRSEDEPTEYRTIEFVGANVVLSPFGHEKMPAGDTLEDKIRTLVRESIRYWDAQRNAEKKFLHDTFLADPNLSPGEKDLLEKVSEYPMHPRSKKTGDEEEPEPESEGE
jgi:hypothetical protein